MSVYNEDSIGKRIAWARKHAEWTDSDGIRHIGMTGHQLGRRLVTQGTVTGVRNVYVSQLENNHASPSLPMLRKIAEVTGVTVGFLLMETDNPYPGGADAEPNYFSPEADAVAKIIDAMPPEERAKMQAVFDLLDAAPPEKRAEMVSVLAAMGWHNEAKAAQVRTQPQPQPATPQRNEFAARLVASDRVAQGRNVVRA